MAWMIVVLEGGGGRGRLGQMCLGWRGAGYYKQKQACDQRPFPQAVK